jgi:hypothetical protein
MSNTSIVGKMGYYLSWSVASAVIVATASGLIATFTPHSATVKWVMYQLLAGIGRGCGLQMVSSVFLIISSVRQLLD